MGRPFSAKLKLNDANEVAFDFGDGDGDDDGEAPDFTGQEPLGAVPEVRRRACSRRRKPTSARRRSGPDKTCDFRSGRMILQRPVERAQMQKLLATGKTDLLQFVSARTARPFSAFLVRAARRQGRLRVRGARTRPRRGRARRAARRRRCACWARIRRTSKPVELHAGRYGPYVKHGDVNATLPDRDKVDALTLDEALALLDEKAAKQGTDAPSKPRRKALPKTAAEPRAAYPAAAKTRKPPAAKPAAAPKVKRASAVIAKAVPKARPKPVAKPRRLPAK